jgi:glycerol-3-phosphate dehydrogenase
MARDFSDLSSRKFDLLVIGGGINGAALANLAAYEGLKVVLLEKNDFASGTSSKSTKLIHGGLRYLESFEFDLVKEALHERYLLVKKVPHLVKPIQFIIPVYKTNPRPFWMLRLGVFLYDFLSGSYKLKSHQVLDKKEMARAIPAIRGNGLVGGIMYSDAQMDDARLCLENVLSAHGQGAMTANHIEVKSLIKENGKTVGVKAFDTITHKDLVIRAKKVVCALGPWTNSFVEAHQEELKNKVRTTKGVHILVRGKVSEHAILLQADEDQRIVFIIPWMGGSLIGTTDTDYNENADEVKPKEQDVNYLLMHVRRFFPHASFDKSNVITSFAGLRPLVYQKGHPSSVSRKHVIEESPSGVVYVMGGKYTTYRKIAEDALKVVMKENIESTENYPLFGAGEISESAQTLAVNYDMSVSTIEYLMGTYGVRYKNILSLIANDSSLKERVCDCSLAIKAQIIYAIENELAVTVDDISRRLNLVYTYCPTKSCLRMIESFKSFIRI